MIPKDQTNIDNISVSNARYVFAGNRFFVLEEMINLKLNIVKIFAAKESYLQKELDKRSISYNIIESKDQFLKELKEISFDYFISNGLPIIIPIAEYKGSGMTFINIHPSCLPDLKGKDPVPGSILFGRNSGATCHLMDEGIDTGDIIWQTTIPCTDDLDCGLLYQLSFLAEKEVFSKAFQRNFKSISAQEGSNVDLYYSMNEKDKEIDFNNDIHSIIRKIKAFSTKSQGAYFIFNQVKYRIFDAEEVRNSFLISRINNYQENEIVFNYENKILIKKQNSFLKLKQIEGDIAQLSVGTRL
jgi:methionyl-tRNA formyltransferase